MKIRDLIYCACTITSTLSLVGYSDDSQIISPQTQAPTYRPTQNLTNALDALGVPEADILAFNQSGQPSPAIVKAVNLYANSSSNLVFNNLSQDQSNALVLFSFVLNNDKKLSDQSLEDLMRAEKLRAGMSSIQIEKLHALTEELKNNSEYKLTPSMVNGIQELSPFITANPFAFADSMGPMIGALIYNSQQGYITPNSDLEETLTEASQQLTGLSDAQIENITNATNNYQTNNTFETNDDNLSDINQALEIAALPLGAYALYPLLGYNAVVGVNNIAGAYGRYFNQGAVNHWNNVATRQGYYNDAAYNRQNTVNQRQENVNEAQGNRQSDVSTRQGSVNEAQGNRQSDVSTRQGSVNEAQGNRQSDVSTRQGNVSEAENRNRSNLNRDNARSAGGSYRGGGRGR